MRSTCPDFRRSIGPSLAALAALVCLTAVGCATHGGAGWADFRSRRAIEKVAADDSFPSAAEAGLSSSEVAATDGG